MNASPETVKKELAKYVAVLTDSLARCRRAEDRSSYEKHLAAAATIMADVEMGCSPEKLGQWLEAETRAYGWGFLSYDEGEAAEGAFNELKKRIG